MADLGSPPEGELLREESVIDELGLSGRHQICLDDDMEAPADTETLDGQAAVALEPTKSFRRDSAESDTRDTPENGRMHRVSTVDMIVNSGGMQDDEDDEDEEDDMDSSQGSSGSHPGIAVAA